MTTTISTKIAIFAAFFAIVGCGKKDKDSDNNAESFANAPAVITGTWKDDTSAQVLTDKAEKRTFDRTRYVHIKPNEVVFITECVDQKKTSNSKADFVFITESRHKAKFSKQTVAVIDPKTSNHRIRRSRNIVSAYNPNKSACGTKGPIARATYKLEGKKLLVNLNGEQIVFKKADKVPNPDQAGFETINN